ncbi:CFEM domain-containing protein [Aspergillus puulaauensis]|uniref:CFEM domain-containing protein n=1 Tax=Aspergillus puulaauensis TaxID=1220207 RepID=A0A7R7XNL7_9EURO|nr:uncharacterized protein APUU_41306S [Aspergillus puulaauensis]BCS24862.1 hypothetical protein APUU_41306S [Aspergillus puulaauensis]
MDLPSCALPCLISAVGNSTCALTDTACVCGTPQIAAQLEPCIMAACTVKEALTSKNMTYTMCDYPVSDDTAVFPITNIVGIVVAIVAVLMRLANRALDRRLALDDYILIFTLLLAAGISGIGIELRNYGLGKDMWRIPFDDIRQILKLFFIEEEMYCVCIATIKISILCLYLNIFPNRGVRIATYIMLAISLVWAIVSFFVLLFSCSPISYYWDMWDGEHTGKCMSHDKILVAHSVSNIVLDVLIVAIPMPTLATLHMPLEKRLGVCVMFAVGIVVTVISIFRLVETVGFNQTTNPTRDFVPVGIWSLLEFDVAIMCACMPAIRSLIIRIYRGQFKPHITALTNSLSGSTRFSSNNNSKNGSDSRTRVSHNLSASLSGSKARGKGPDDAVGPFIRLDDVGTTADAYYNGAGVGRNGRVGGGGGGGGAGRGYPGDIDLSGPPPGSPGVGPAPVPGPVPVQSPSRSYFKRWSLFSRKSSEPPQTPMLPPAPTSPSATYLVR